MEQGEPTPSDAVAKPERRKPNFIVQLFHSGAATGIILFLMAVIAMVWANSPWGGSYFHLWHLKFGFVFESEDFRKATDLTLHHWINDGLMAIFFFVIGLEIKREVIAGELSSLRKAMLPAGAAFGGMLFPALVYFYFNTSGEASNGWGIPMATDIAFSLGLLTLVKSRVPVAVKVFLAGLAIVDDIGAVLVIAFFYTEQLSFLSLAVGGGGMAILLIANRMGVRSVPFYGVVGIGVIWLAFLLSGVHATIAGVLAAFTIPASVKVDEKRFVDQLKVLGEKMERIKPARGQPLITHDQLELIDKVKKLGKDADTPLQRLEHRMNPFVSYFVMPVFALANAGVMITGDFLEILIHPVTLGVIFGLLVGKFVGIVGICKILVRTGLAALPSRTRWAHIYGTALMAAIGFTMSLFITELAFESEELALRAKVGILTASSIAMVLGLVILRYFTPDPEPEEEEEE